ncbi:MAG: Ig-like domain-containing protein, partial [Candidatus Omnitrophota bacterium]
MRKTIIFIAAVAVFLALCSLSFAQNEKYIPLSLSNATVVALKGDVLIKKPNQDWAELRIGDSIYAEDALRIGRDSNVEVIFGNRDDVVFRFEEEMEFYFYEVSQKTPQSFQVSIRPGEKTRVLLILRDKDWYERYIQEGLRKDLNSPPILEVIPEKSAEEGQFVEFLIKATDLDNDKLTFEATGLPKNAYFIYVDPNTYRFSFKPAYDQEGNYTIIFTVTDGLASDSEIVPIKIGDAAATERPTTEVFVYEGSVEVTAVVDGQETGEPIVVAKGETVGVTQEAAAKPGEPPSVPVISEVVDLPEEEAFKEELFDLWVEEVERVIDTENETLRQILEEVKETLQVAKDNIDFYLDEATYAALLVDTRDRANTAYNAVAIPDDTNKALYQDIQNLLAEIEELRNALLGGEEELEPEEAINYEPLIRISLNELVEAYNAENLGGFMSYVSGDFLRDREKLREAVQQDFDNFSEIRLVCSISRFLDAGDKVEVGIHWENQVKVTGTGTLVLSSGDSSFVFTKEEIPQLFDYTGDVIFGILSPEVSEDALVVTPSGSVDVNLYGTRQFTATRSGVDVTTIVTWSSSDDTVGTVDDSGLFTAEADGTTTVKAASA